jgi:hypothetical protein
MLVGASMAWGAPVLVASCSSASSPGVVAPSEGGVDAPGDKGTCAIPDVKARCDGADPAVVFFPPVTCDPAAARDAGSSPDAFAGDAADPCANVTKADVTFTPTACRAFADAETGGRIDFTNSPRAPTLAEPIDGSALTPDEWSIFAWAKGAEARRSPFEWLEPSAHALTPLTGDGYVITFTQGCNEVLRAMVTTTFWIPDIASWNTLTSLQGPVTVRVYWAKYATDGLAAGPVASPPITITMSH